MVISGDRSQLSFWVWEERVRLALEDNRKKMILVNIS